ncbi:MAG TPA: hypothetical protein VMF87_16855 [Streptosporangiaceae bacterium]|jgi:hypothetical protein|nr:hypothetical protein [Streptosporangiaceae bacterium]
MPDEPSDNDRAWWMPPGRPEPAEHDDLIGFGSTRPSRPIGPMSPRSWSRRPYVVAGVAVAALLGGAGAALASSGSGSPTGSPSAVAASPAPSPAPQGPTGPGGHGGHGGFRRFGAGGFGGLFGALHGQLVVTKPGGGYETVDVQSGQVTAVSTTSITVKSADGYSKSYAVAASTNVDAQRDGIGSVKVGNQVSLLATVSGGTATATSITDQTLLPQGHPGFGFGRAKSGSSSSSGAQAG